MRITTRGQLAVTAMTDLAWRQRMSPVALSSISARQGTSLSYLEQLFSALRRAGLVESTRGPGGGYMLARKSQDISVADILLAVESYKDDGIVPMESGQAEQVRAMTGELWLAFSERVREYLHSVTLQSLVEQQAAKGHVPEEPPAPKPKRSALRTDPRPPLMAHVGVPNSVFALAGMPILQRR